MRILFLCPNHLSDPKRGTPLRASHLARALRQHADVHLVALSVPADFRGHCTLFPPTIRGLNWFVRLRYFLRACKVFQPDIVYGQTHNSLFLLWVSRLKGIPSCVDYHGDAIVDIGAGWWRGIWLRTLYAFFLRRIDGVTTVHSGLRTLYPAPRARWHLLHGGVDMQQIDRITAVSLPDVQHPLITYCGNLNSYQGVDVLLTALQSMIALPWEFLLICSSGENQARALLQQYALADRTILLNNLSQDETFGYLKAADIAVVPRPDVPITRTAFPSKLPEYLASGAAVICSDVADASILVRNGETGWLVRPGDAVDLTRALNEAINDPQERLKRAQNAGVLMRRSYDWPVLAARLTDFFQSLIA